MEHDLEVDDSDDNEGFNDRIRIALKLDEDIAIITYSDGDEKFEEKDEESKNVERDTSISYFDNYDNEGESVIQRRWNQRCN